MRNSTRRVRFVENAKTFWRYVKICCILSCARNYRIFNSLMKNIFSNHLIKRSQCQFFFLFSRTYILRIIFFIIIFLCSDNTNLLAFFPLLVKRIKSWWKILSWIIQEIMKPSRVNEGSLIALSAISTSKKTFVEGVLQFFHLQFCVLSD